MLLASSSNELKVDFANGFVTFRMHADLGMDLIRWLRNQVNRIQVIGKRADKIEQSALDLPPTKSTEWNTLTDQAEAVRNQGDEIAMCVEYIKRASLGWTDFFEDAEAQTAGQPLPFTEENIARLGVMNLTKVINAFNLHYGLTAEDDAGKAKGESLPALSPSATAAASSQTGIASSAPIAS